MKKNIRYGFYLLALLLAFTLVAACGGGGSDSDDPPPAVVEENTPPVADAGADREMAVGDVATLDGSGSTDADDDPLTFSWTLTRPDGSEAELSDATASQPTFRADVEGVFVLHLIVHDGVAASTADVVTITVNALPVVTPAVAAWPYNLATVVEEIDANGDGSVDDRYLSQYDYDGEGRIEESKLFIDDENTPRWTETFVYADGVLTDTNRVGSWFGDTYSRTYEYAGENLIRAIASGGVQNVYAYEYTDGTLSATVKTPGEVRTDLEYEGGLLSHEIETEGTEVRERIYNYEGGRLVEERYVTAEGEWTRTYAYGNGRLVEISRQVPASPARTETIRLSYAQNGDLERAHYEHRNNGVLEKTETVSFTFNSRGMPAADFAYPYPLFGGKKEPLVPRILKTFLGD